MNRNELWHFGLINNKHPLQDIVKDDNGRLVFENDRLVWKSNAQFFGEVDIVSTDGAVSKELVLDLQTGNDCYCAELIEVKEKPEYEPFSYLYIYGSGWKELGFPFYEEDFDPEDPYKRCKGCYAMLRGKALNRFLKIVKADRIPSVEEIMTGNRKADFVLTGD